MKYMFEVKTTCSKPFYLSVSEETPLYEARDMILNDVEYNTILMKSDVLDIFIPCGDICISITNSNDTIRSFIQKHASSFGEHKQAYDNGFYCIYVIDNTYVERIKSKHEAPIYNDVIPPPSQDGNAIKNILKSTIGLVTGSYV